MKKIPIKYKFAFAGIGLALIPATIFGVTIAITKEVADQKETQKTLFEENGFLGVCESLKGDLIVAKDYVGRDDNGKPMFVSAFKGIAKRLPGHTANQTTVISPVFDLAVGVDCRDLSIHTTPNGDCFVVHPKQLRPSPYMESYRFEQMVSHGQIPAVPRRAPG